MADLFQQIQQTAAEAVKDHYQVDIDPGIFPLQETRKDFEGDFTLVVFPLTRYKLGSPQQIGETLGSLLVERLDALENYNVVKGFLNLSLSDKFWQDFLAQSHMNENWFRREGGQGKTVVVEYCSPNTNKPLHLGHLRNIALGYSLTEILKANGFEVHPTILFNDRGTNISKSMIAWQKAGKGDTPESLGIKGDKLVGDYYVDFAHQLREQSAELIAQGVDKREAENKAPIMQEVHRMTEAWEAGDPEIRALWEKMNGWVYEAYKDTFKRLGVHFEQFYYESKVYLRGKETVKEGIEKGIFYQTDDGAVVADLTDDGLDKKLLLRSNGTSLYITQDLAIAEDKYNEFGMDKSIYVVGNEQDYHFKVLFTILQKLGKPYGEGLFHLSYGMVDLPSGKMKSREGTTVEADDLMDQMIDEAKAESQKNPDKIEGLTEAELKRLYDVLGLGALKYFLLKVDPKKRMLFDPNESIQLKGHTGPFIQYSFTRTQALMRKAGDELKAFNANDTLESALLSEERELLKLLFGYPQVLAEAGNSYNPALIANYAYEIAKSYNKFYHEAPILKSDQLNTSRFRLALSAFAGKTLREAMRLLGIEMPDRM